MPLVSFYDFLCVLFVFFVILIIAFGHRGLVLDMPQLEKSSPSPTTRCSERWRISQYPFGTHTPSNPHGSGVHHRFCRGKMVTQGAMPSTSTMINSTKTGERALNCMHKTGRWSRSRCYTGPIGRGGSRDPPLRKDNHQRPDASRAPASSVGCRAKDPEVQTEVNAIWFVKSMRVYIYIQLEKLVVFGKVHVSLCRSRFADLQPCSMFVYYCYVYMCFYMLVRW